MTGRTAEDLAWTVDRLRASLRLPLVSAPMFKVSGLELVKAVCRSGAIGAFPSINARTPDGFESWLDELESDRGRVIAAGQQPAPYAVNLLTHDSNARFAPDFEIIQRRKPPIVITSVGRPEVVVEAVHGYGGLVFADVVSLRHARRSADFGVDGMVLLCAGAGGQTGRLNPFAFIEAVRAFYDGLLIVAGGITRGHQLRSIEIAGADLGYCGTRFIATDESAAEPGHKEAVIGAEIDDVWDTDALSGIPASTLRSSLEKLGLTPETRWIQQGRANYDWAAVKEIPGVYSLGHGAGDIRSLEPVSTVIDRLAQEYVAASGLGSRTDGRSTADTDVDRIGAP